MRKKIAKLASMHLLEKQAKTMREWARSDFKGTDDPRQAGEYTGAEGERDSSLPSTLNQALARGREVADMTSTEFFMAVAPSYKPGVEFYPDPNTRSFSGPDGRPRASLPNPKNRGATVPKQPDHKYLETVVNELLPQVQNAYKTLKGEVFGGHDLKVKWDTEGIIPAESIARHQAMDDGSSVIYIKPKAANDLSYLYEVVKHELIHFYLRTPDTEDEHGLEFKQMADMVNLPEIYRD